MKLYFEIEGIERELKDFQDAIKKGEFKEFPLVKNSIEVMAMYLRLLKYRIQKELW